MDKKKQNHFGLGMAIFAVTTLIIMVYSMFTMTIKATGIGLDTTNELHPDFWADACFGYWKIKVYFCPMMVEDVPQLLDGGAFTKWINKLRNNFDCFLHHAIRWCYWILCVRPL